MSSLDALLAEGLKLHQAGQLPQASVLYRKILDVQPQHPGALHLQGLVLFQQGSYHEACELIRQATQLEDTVAVFHNNLAAVLLELEELQEAVLCCYRALRLQPQYADAYANLGFALHRQGKRPQAEAAYRQALKLAPGHRDALRNLANLMCELGEFHRAAQLYQATLAANPSDAAGWYHAAAFCLAAGDLDQAIRLYTQAVLLDPENTKAWTSLGTAYRERGQVPLARSCYRQVLKKRPEDFLARLRLDALCPVVFSSSEAIDQYRSWLTLRLQQCKDLEFSTTPSELGASNANPPFQLTYHGRNDRPIKELYAQVFQHRLVQPDPLPSRSQVPRVGLVVTSNHEGVFLRSLQGLLEYFRTEVVQLTVVCSASGRQRIQSAVINPAVEYLVLEGSLARMAETIRQARFDVLYYWEISSDSMNYFLPMLRLAPVQATGFGVQSTSGLSQVDFYLSSRLTEPPEAAEHYSEKLLLLETLPAFQYRSHAPHSGPTREEFHLPPVGHMYLCPQYLGKFHPDFDALIGAILRLDPQGFLVITEGTQHHAVSSLQARFAKSIPDVAPRILFVRWLAREKFLELLALADVILDSLHFGGVNTTYDALSLSQPVVTLPMKYQRGRYTAACYQRMGLTDCVAHSQQQYVELAVRLATEASFCQHQREQISAAAHCLFEDMQTVREYEKAFAELAGS